MDVGWQPASGILQVKTLLWTISCPSARICYMVLGPATIGFLISCPFPITSRKGYYSKINEKFVFPLFLLIILEYDVTSSPGKVHQQ